MISYINNISNKSIKYGNDKAASADNFKDLADLAIRLASHIEQDQKHHFPTASLDDTRTLFEKENDKVIFSDYLRALQTKAQTALLPIIRSSAYHHTRLTHSLEVSTIARRMSKRFTLLLNKAVRKNSPEHSDFVKSRLHHVPQILSTAALLHDIGNPPYGHPGEAAIKHFFSQNFTLDPETDLYRYKNLSLTAKQLNDFRYFDGNANSFRIANRLAGKYNGDSQTDSGISGLNLTKVTRSTLIKYPWLAGAHPKKPDKFGWFLSEQNIPKVEWKGRYPLTYLVDTADEIAYLVMDIEDGLKSGKVSFYELCQRYPDALNYLKDQKVITNAEIAELSAFNAHQPMQQNALKALESVRSNAISFLVNQVIEGFNENPDNKNGKPLIKEIKTGNAISVLDKVLFHNKPDAYKQWKDFRNHYIPDRLYFNTDNAELQIGATQIFQYLLDLFITAVSDTNIKKRHYSHFLLLKHLNIKDWDKASDYEKVQSVLDYLTKLSDYELTDLYKTYKGIF